MRHKKFESLIVLDFYDETSQEEKTKLEKHLSSCSRCSRFRQSLSKTILHSKQHDHSSLNEALEEARQGFHRSLLEEKRTDMGRDFSSVVKDREFKFRRTEKRFAPVPAYAVVAIAFVMLAAGATTSFLFLNKTEKSSGSMLSELTSENRDDVAIDNVRFLPGGQKSGEVKFSFDFIKRYEMNGSLDDHNVQKVLAFALGNSDNVGVRLKTVGMLETSSKTDKEVEGALVKAAKFDDNAGVRREALLSLKKLPFDNEIRSALLFALKNDKNPGIRVLAINFLSDKELTSSGPKVVDPNVLNVLREKSLSDQNQYVRLKAAGMLKEITEL
jgi:hypothetical protein